MKFRLRLSVTFVFLPLSYLRIAIAFNLAALLDFQLPFLCADTVHVAVTVRIIYPTCSSPHKQAYGTSDRYN
jgi:hypothetical protein